MRKNSQFKLQIRTHFDNGTILGWDDAKSKESHYEEDQYLPKKSEISKWFMEDFVKSEDIAILWSAGCHWGCYDKDGQLVEYRVVRRKDGTQI